MSTKLGAIHTSTKCYLRASFSPKRLISEHIDILGGNFPLGVFLWPMSKEGPGYHLPPAFHEEATLLPLVDELTWGERGYR